MQYRHPLIYARFSDPRSDGSLERQVRELETFAASLGIHNAHVIAEDDVTGWTVDHDRKGHWPDVIQGLTDGTYDCLIVRSLDRCARDVVETINLARLAERYGFGFHALNGDKLDKLTAMFRGYASEEESRVKSQRLKLKWADKASQGNYHPGRWRPYGFRYSHDERGVINGLVVDPIEADIVREVANRLCAGESPHSIAIELERRGVPTVSDSQWQRMMVVRLVKPVSAGLLSHNGEVMPGNHQAIITPEEFWQVRAALKKGESKPDGHNARKHLLAGMVVCSRCGVVMQCNGRVYQCTTKNTGNGRRGCGTIAISKARIEELVINSTVDYLTAQEGVAIETVEADWSQKLAEAAEEEQAIQAAYAAGEITATQWLAGLKVARQRLQVAQDGRATQLTKLTGVNLAKLAGSAAATSWGELNLSQRRAVLREMYEAFVVKPGHRGSKIFKPERVEIVWH